MCVFTSVKCHWLGKYYWPVECDKHSLFVRASTDLLLQSITQTNPSTEICHLMKIRPCLLIDLRQKASKKM